MDSGCCQAADKEEVGTFVRCVIWCCVQYICMRVWQPNQMSCGGLWHLVLLLLGPSILTFVNIHTNKPRHNNNTTPSRTGSLRLFAARAQVHPQLFLRLRDAARGEVAVDGDGGDRDQHGRGAHQAGGQLSISTRTKHQLIKQRLVGSYDQNQRIVWVLRNARMSQQDRDLFGCVNGNQV